MALIFELRTTAGWQCLQKIDKLFAETPNAGCSWGPKNE